LGGTAADGPQPVAVISVQTFDDLLGIISLRSPSQQTSIATSKKFVAGRSFIFAPHHLLGAVLFYKAARLNFNICLQSALSKNMLLEHKLYLRLFSFRCYFLTSSRLLKC